MNYTKIDLDNPPPFKTGNQADWMKFMFQEMDGFEPEFAGSYGTTPDGLMWEMWFMMSEEDGVDGEGQTYLVKEDDGMWREAEFGEIENAY